MPGQGGEGLGQSEAYERVARLSGLEGVLGEEGDIGGRVIDFIDGWLAGVEKRPEKSRRAFAIDVEAVGMEGGFGGWR